MNCSIRNQLFFICLYLSINQITRTFHHVAYDLSTNRSTDQSIDNIKLDEIWFIWKTKFNKSYDRKVQKKRKTRGQNKEGILVEWNSETEEDYRREIWNSNIHRILLHNLRYDLGLVTYTLGLNQFSDLTWTEFSLIHLPALMPKNMHKSINSLKLIKPMNKTNYRYAPDSFNWKDKGVVTDVKNQGDCGCGWAFASVGALEGQMNRASIPVQSLSAQQLIDCSMDYGNFGCIAGLMTYAYDYISDNGIESERNYPFVGEELPCQHIGNSSVIRSRSYFIIPEGEEITLKYSLYDRGPFAGAISFAPDFIFYKKGVYQSDDCSSVDVMHGILIIGYGYEDKEEYWLLKNSWGKSWGENGYAKIKRNDHNMCGIATMAIIPTL
ncbi:unnamed protein product [Trichobilharzia szidati]|nr:unnamed protein product [Trichobilharzia szidati]